MAHYGMARVIRGRDRAAAVAHLDAALQTDPQLVDALQLRALERARLGDRGALDDVELLVKAPTAQRLYNAACAVAIYAEVPAAIPGCLDRAMKLLAYALDAGIPGPAGGRRPRSPGQSGTGPNSPASWRGTRRRRRRPGAERGPGRTPAVATPGEGFSDRPHEIPGRGTEEKTHSSTKVCPVAARPETSRFPRRHARESSTTHDR